MKITDPVLVPDVSLWCDHINTQEFIDGGCQSVIVGMYQVSSTNGKMVLSPESRAQAQAVAKSSLVLQAYMWDDLTKDPEMQAQWLLDTIKSEGFPVRWIWADVEQFWTNWNQYYSWRAGTLPLEQVQHPNGQVISDHYHTFMQTLAKSTNRIGVYSNKGFIDSWSTQMNIWLPKYSAWVAEYAHEPTQQTLMTWAQLKQQWLPNYDLILSEGQVPSQVVGHQFTGDLCRLPGSYDLYNHTMPLDVSVFSKFFIDTIRTGSVPVTGGASGPVPVVVPAYKTMYPMNVRMAASQTAKLLGIIPVNTTVYIKNIVPGSYSYFEPNDMFPQGGYLYSYYLKKL